MAPGKYWLQYCALHSGCPDSEPPGLHAFSQGSGVGASVGASVGATVGKVVGASVGAAVGVAVLAQLKTGEASSESELKRAY